MRAERMLHRGSVTRLRGFTLLEVLVVVIIVGVLVTFATLSVGNRALADQLQLEARRLNATLRLALEEAELKGQIIGFRYTPEYYEFLSPGPEGRWEPRIDGPFRRRALAEPLQVNLRVEDRTVAPARDAQDQEKGPEPQILLLPNGEVSAFSLALSADGVDEFYRVDADALGRFEFQRLTRRGV